MNVRTIFSSARWLWMCLLLAGAREVTAAPFNSATVTRLQNKAVIAEIVGGQVKGSRPAVVDDVVVASKFLQTEGDARAELQFPDKSLARVGSNSIFSFDAQSRTLKLDKGDMLFYLPPGAGGVKIKTAALTAALTGTVVLVKSTGFLVLEGTVTITYTENGKKKTMQLEAGTDHNAVKTVDGRLVGYRSGIFDPAWTFERGKLVEWKGLPGEVEAKIAQFSPWPSETSIFLASNLYGNATERFPFGRVNIPVGDGTPVTPTPTPTNNGVTSPVTDTPKPVTDVQPAAEVPIIEVMIPQFELLIPQFLRANP